MTEYPHPTDPNRILKIRNKLSELLLFQYQDMGKYAHEMAKCIIELDKTDKAYARGEIDEEFATEEKGAINDEYVSHMTACVMILASKKDQNQIKKLTPTELHALYNMLELDVPPETDMDFQIKIKGVNKAQIEELEKEKKKLKKGLHDKEIFALNRRIESLQTNTLVLWPVQKAIFASKMMTDNVRKSLMKVPEPIKKLCEDKGWDVSNVQDRIKNEWMKGTPEEQKQYHAFDAMLAEYRSAGHLELLLKAQEFLAHLLVPPGEEYSLRWAKHRKEFIKKGNAAKVMAMLNFICAVLNLWNISTAIASTRSLKKAKLMKLFQSANNLQRFTAGRQYFKGFSESIQD